VIDTPGFVAVGTNGALKALDSQMVESIGLQLLFCNTYHLLLQPGIDVIRKAGGLHRFMNRKGPIITDSGGFQVFSLAYGSVAAELKSAGAKKGEGHILKIDEEGVLFRSYRDGAKVLLTPESSIEAQKGLGADIIIPFDELPPYHIGIEELKRSFDRTHRWEIRSLNEHMKNVQNQAMYAVIHGGVDIELRKLSCYILMAHPFDGFAIGGSLGKTKDEMVSMLQHVTMRLPDDKPRHLLGIGDLESIDRCIPLGIDTFDSSYPTKAARHGLLLTHQGAIKVETKEWAHHFGPIESGCSCYTCTHFTMSYLHHLFKAHELTAYTLATIHNLHWLVERMRRYREEIAAD
jgi:queuine tRNA-ribosyltransferase